MKIRRIFTFLFALGMTVACGRETEQVGTKLAGVGRSPDDIGPVGQEYGGLVEYNWLDFAGGGLSMASSGIGFFFTGELSPANTQFKPPYSLVAGLGFIFDQKVPEPDAYHGMIPSAPNALDSCWTDYEPFAFLSASPVDVGAWMKFRTPGDTTVFEVTRSPAVYPPDPQDVSTAYQGFSAYRPKPLKTWTPGTGPHPSTMEETVVLPVNYSPQTRMIFEFPGGISPLEAPVGSIPLPSSYTSANEPVLTTPGFPEGVLLEWAGATYDHTGAKLTDSGENSACLRYYAGDQVPADAWDCTSLPAVPRDTNEIPGQIYTGPWDSEDGVTFNWTTTDTEEETGAVMLNIKFLGPVDRDAEDYATGLVAVDADSSIEEKWDNQLANGSVEGELPQGYRPVQACDYVSGEDDPSVLGDEVVYGPDPALVEGDGDMIVPLRGDPNFNLVEVSCRLHDDGEFTLTNEHLTDAMAYAVRNAADGAVFTFGRYTEAAAEIPDVMNQRGHRHVVTPVLLKSHAVKVGRFWWDNDEQGGEK